MSRATVRMIALGTWLAVSACESKFETSVSNNVNSRKAAEAAEKASGPSVSTNPTDPNSAINRAAVSDAEPVGEAIQDLRVIAVNPGDLQKAEVGQEVVITVNNL